MKKYSILVVLLASSMLAFGFTMEADAEPISIAITAQISEINQSDEFPEGWTGLPPDIKVGGVITGTYVYESTTPDSSPLSFIGLYKHSTAPFGITLNVGGYVFRTYPNIVDFRVSIVNDDSNTDYYEVFSYNNIFDISFPGPDHEIQSYIYWTLYDPTGTAVSSIALPTVAPVLADWESVSLYIESYKLGSYFQIIAHVTSAELISPGFSFTGFFPPIGNPPILNVVKAGSAIPVKFSLNGDKGLDIFAAGYPKSQQIACDTDAPLVESEEVVTAGSSSLSYDTDIDEYNYVWKTNKAWRGTCRQLIVRLSDGIDHVANFHF